MTPQDIVRIIKSFFDAILRVLVSLGVIEEEETTAAPSEEDTTA